MAERSVVCRSERFELIWLQATEKPLRSLCQTATAPAKGFDGRAKSGLKSTIGQRSPALGIGILEGFGQDAVNEGPRNGLIN